MAFNLVLKVGNQKNHMGFKDGMPVCTLPAHEVLSERMRTVYAIVTLPDSLLSAAVAACGPLAIGEDDVRSRCKYVDLTSLAIALGDPTLEAKWRAAGIMVPVQRGAGFDDSIFLDSQGHEWPDVPDNNAIAQGSYTVGSGADYSNWAAALGDVDATLTGDLDFTQLTPTSEAGVSLSVAMAGYNLTLDSSNPTKGDPTAGWASTFTSSGIVVTMSGAAGSGLIEVKNLLFERTAGVTTVLQIITQGPSMSVHDTMIRHGTCTGSGLQVTSSSGASSSTKGSIWNVSVYDNTSGSGSGIELSAAYSAEFTLENCNCVDTGTNGFNVLGSGAPVFRNCYAVQAGTNDFNNIGSCTGENNASGDTTAADGNWSVGTGNLTSVSAASAFVSSIPTNPEFMKVLSTGPLADAGTTVTLVGNVRGSRGGPRPHAGLFSIGSDELVTINPGLKGKQIQLDASSFDGALSFEDDTVQKAIATLDATAGGISSTLNKDMVPNATTSDGDQATDEVLQRAPRGDIQVLVNGISVPIGDGVKTTFCYFSGDSGTTARALDSLERGDTLHWNGTYANFELDANDVLDFIFEAVGG